MQPARIHILGAAGSGTSTLGAALAGELGCPQFDVDTFMWLPTDPPFEQIRPAAERLAQLESALASATGWVLSGSLCGWGDPLIGRFSLVVFLSLPAEVRLARLRAREAERYGPAGIAAGGAHHARYRRFIDWAAAYDEGDLSLRSRRLHEAWLADLPCPVVRLDGQCPTDEQVAAVRRTLAACGGQA